MMMASAAVAPSAAPRIRGRLQAGNRSLTHIMLSITPCHELYSLAKLLVRSVLALGAAVLVCGAAAAEERIAGVLSRRAVEARVPAAQGVAVPRAELAAQDCNQISISIPP